MICVINMSINPVDSSAVARSYVGNGRGVSADGAIMGEYMYCSAAELW